MSSVNFSGLASGIDSSALIDSIIQQRRKLKITPLKEQQTATQDTTDTMKELKTALNDLKDKVEKFRVLNGGGVKTGITSSDESVLTAKTIGSLSSGTYNMTVSQRAQNASLSFNERYSSMTSAAAPLVNDSDLATDRTLTVKVGTGASQESIGIELNSSKSISDIMENFNSQSTQATASIINVGTTGVPSYALSFTSKNSGSEKGAISVSVGSSITAASTFTSSSLSQATDASLSISGITGSITRSSNTITDLIPGMSLDVGGVGTSTLVVGTDTDSTLNGVKDFVSAYNKVMSLIKDNDLVTQENDGGEVKNIFGSLSGTSVDESIRDSIRQTLGGITSSDGGSTMILADLGIATERDGTLKLNEDTFKTALKSNPSGVTSLLQNVGDTLGSTGGNIAQFTKYQGIIDKLVQSYDNDIATKDKQISEVEESLSAEESRLRSQYATLEKNIGTMNSQRASLARLLP
jgi:flagellar hook-associated protein 2